MATTLFELLGRIAIDNASANKGIKETTGHAESASLKIGAAFEKIGSAAIKVGTVIASGMAAGATAIGALTKASVEGYANYEQLIGGVETLFKKTDLSLQEYAASVGKSAEDALAEWNSLTGGSRIVMRNAEEAYKSAGLSANEYMETVTSFSASLLQGLGGDTVAAAKIADRAITDMSDNANKMGTSMSLIQNAYQGFAKQNYTLLDNLKLGYGGTQSEMARLVNESGVLGETIEVTAETINDVSFDKIIEAIGVVQDRMGITGTTAKEASKTISGSVSAMKAAWSNLLVGMSDETADFEELIDRFVESCGTAAENIIPRIEIALEGAGKLVDKMFPIIIEKVPKIINEFLPKVVNSAVSIVKSLISGIDENKDSIFKTAVDICETIITAIAEMLPEILELGLELLLTICDGIIDNLDKIASSALEIIGKIIEILTKPSTLEKLLDASIEIIIAIAEGLIEFLPELTEASKNIVDKIVEVVSDGGTLNKLLDAAIAVVEAVAQFIVDNVSLLVEAAIELVAKLAEYILDPENLTKLITTAASLISELCKGLSENVGLLEEKAKELGNAIADTLKNMDWEAVGLSIGEMVSSGLGLMDDLLMPDIINANTGQKVQRKTFDEVFGGKKDGSHADGLDYVPYDGYIAELHRGEMVVPAAEAQGLRGGSSVASLLESILYAIRDANSSNMSLELNHREFARLVKAVN